MCRRVHLNLNGSITFHYWLEIVLKINIKLFLPESRMLAESGTCSEKLLLLFLLKQADHGSAESSPEKHMKH